MGDFATSRETGPTNEGLLASPYAEAIAGLPPPAGVLRQEAAPLRHGCRPQSAAGSPDASALANLALVMSEPLSPPPAASPPEEGGLLETPEGWRRKMPAVNIEHVLPDSPFRRPDWRWCLAHLLAARQVPPTLLTPDAPTLEAIHYLERHRQRKVTPFAPPAAPDWRPLEEALALYRAPPDARAEMEARILAGEDTPAVARKCGLAEEVIDTYHDLFFDLRPKLGCSSYVVCQILGDPSRVIEESDRPSLLKLLAYFGGPHVLDELLWYYRTPPKDVPLRLKHLSLAELKEMRRWANVRLFILIFTYRPETDVEKIRYQWLSLHRWHRCRWSTW
jgi:hypothetical protein